MSWSTHKQHHNDYRRRHHSFFHGCGRWWCLVLVTVSLLAAQLSPAAAESINGYECPPDVVPLDSITTSDISSIASGKTYQLANGTYTVSSTLVPDTVTTCLIGSSPEGVIILVQGLLAAGFLIYDDGAVLGLKGLTVNGQGTSGGVLITAGVLTATNVIFDASLAAPALEAYSNPKDIALTSVLVTGSGNAPGAVSAVWLHTDPRSAAYQWQDVRFTQNVATALGLGSSTVLTLSGNAEFTDNDMPGSYGGALALHDDAQVIFTGTARFDSNSAGTCGAIYLDDRAAAEFRGPLVVQDNTAGDGGGACVFANSTLTAVGPSQWLANSATRGNGGALVLNAGTGRLNNQPAAASFRGPVLMQDNIAASAGGAVALFDGASLAIAAGSTFASNNAGERGGAFALSAGATVRVTTTGSICIQDNSARREGGGIYAEEANSGVFLNGVFDQQVMGNNMPNAVVLASGAFLGCGSAGSEVLRGDGTYDITGPICACSAAQGSTSVCGCPTGQYWNGADCACVRQVCLGPCCASESSFKPEGAVCRDASGPCDLPEACTGDSAECPPDTWVANNTLCGYWYLQDPEHHFEGPYHNKVYDEPTLAAIMATAQPEAEEEAQIQNYPGFQQHSHSQRAKQRYGYHFGKHRVRRCPGFCTAGKCILTMRDAVACLSDTRT